MPAWFEELWHALFGEPESGGAPLFRRHIALSSSVVTWLHDPSRTSVERWAFAELLLKLDADPIRHSQALLGRGLPPGMRWSVFNQHKAILLFNPAEDRIKVLTCS